jgi:putative membrane protein
MRQTNMKWLRTSVWILTVAVISFSCQQSPSNVQASREPTVPGVTNGGTSQSSNSKDVLLSQADRDFMKKAEDSDIRERNLGRFIMQKSQTTTVRDYGKMLADDHTKDLHNVIDLMESKGIHQPKNLPEVKQEALDQLNNLSGPALDRAFLEIMVKDHENNVALYRRETQSGEDPAVREYAARALLTLQEHLKKAQELQNKLTQSSTR